MAIDHKKLDDLLDRAIEDEQFRNKVKDNNWKEALDVELNAEEEPYVQGFVDRVKDKDDKDIVKEGRDLKDKLGKKDDQEQPIHPLGYR